MAGVGAIIVDAVTIGRSHIPARTNADGFAVPNEPAVSLQQAGWVTIAAAAFSCAQHGFVAQESRLAIAGKMPEMIRIATAMKSVRMTVANRCTMFAIPNGMAAIDIRT